MLRLFRFVIFACAVVAATAAWGQPSGTVTQIPGKIYIGNTDVTVPDPANGDTNGAAISVTGAISLTGILTAYTPIGPNLIFETDVLGHLLRVDDTQGHSTYVYDSASPPLSAVGDGNGGTVYFHYDGMHRLTGTDESSPSSSGPLTRYQYDFSSRPTTTETIDPHGHVTQYTYQYGAGSGELTQVTDPNGTTIMYQYDPTNRPTSSTDQLGNTTTYTYDAQGRMATESTPSNTTTYGYDAQNRLISSIDSPSGDVTTESWSNGLLQSTTDPLGHTTTYMYDAQNRLTQAVDPLGHATTYTYDALNRLTEIDRPGGNVTTYTYDAQSRLVSIGGSGGGGGGGGALSISFVPEASSFFVWCGVAVALAIRRSR